MKRRAEISSHKLTHLNAFDRTGPSPIMTREIPSILIKTFDAAYNNYVVLRKTLLGQLCFV